jgi:extracellular elastinolytic metalloproteinase
VDCADDAEFSVVFTSPADAFPSIAPRPRAPELIMRSFNIPKTRATHVRLRVLTNQCTGAPDYQGEQDNDPRAVTDCATASAQALNVRAAELQVFRR